MAKRQRNAAEWNNALPTATPTRYQRLRWALRSLRCRSLPDDLARYGTDGAYSERRRTLEEEWRMRSGRRKGSLVWALNDISAGFWVGGLFKVAGDAAQMMSPLLVKALIRFSQQGTSRRSGDQSRHLIKQCTLPSKLESLNPPSEGGSEWPWACGDWSFSNQFANIK